MSNTKRIHRPIFYKNVKAIIKDVVYGRPIHGKHDTKPRECPEKTRPVSNNVDPNEKSSELGIGGTAPAVIPTQNTSETMCFPTCVGPDSTNPGAEPLPAKNRHTFPLSEKEDLEFKAKGSKTRTAAPRETETPGQQQQPVPDDFKRTDKNSKQILQREFQSDIDAMTEKLLELQRRRDADTKAAEDSKQFVRAWELKLLPALEKIMDDNVKDGYSINVRRGEETGHRVIEIMTSDDVKTDVQTTLQEAKDKHLDGDLKTRTTMRFRLGYIKRLAEENPTLRSTQSEEWLTPVNTRRYTNPVMGDSIGPHFREGGSATMGPLLQIAQKLYRILNWHTFDDEDQCRRCEDPNPPALDAYHPSLDDAMNSGEQSISIGKTVAYSGLMHKTWRMSNSIQSAFQEELGEETSPVKTVTDWVLVETTTKYQVNKVRGGGISFLTDRCNSFSKDVTMTANPKVRGSQLVYSTGRSSGHSFGQICEVPSLYVLRGGVRTRNWCIESTAQGDDWNRGGMGIPGDSGAPVIEQTTDKLLGQIWGRDKYDKSDGKSSPVTYFSAISDIYDDIQERMQTADVPKLPTNASRETSRSASPIQGVPPIANDGRRPTLASISEDGDEQPVAQTGNLIERRSNARSSTPMARLSGYGGKLPGLEPVRRWTMIAHAATF